MFRYTINAFGELVSYRELLDVDEPLNENETDVQCEGNFYIPKFDKEKQEWTEGKPTPEEPPKELTKEEQLKLQMERDKVEMISKYEAKELVEEAITEITSMMFGL